MTIALNGVPQSVQDAETIAQLVTELGLPAPALLIEHNGTALLRHEWTATPLGEGDKVEILRVVAGG